MLTSVSKSGNNEQRLLVTIGTLEGRETRSRSFALQSVVRLLNPDEVFVPGGMILGDGTAETSLQLLIYVLGLAIGLGMVHRRDMVVPRRGTKAFQNRDMN